MECDEHAPTKNPRIDIGNEVISMEQEVDFNFESLKEMIEEEPATEERTRGEATKNMVVAQPLVVLQLVATQSKRNPLGVTHSKKKGIKESLLRYKKYSFTYAVEGQLKTEKQMLTSYGKLKEWSMTETQNKSKELRNL